jgi:hypothetical protein
MVSFFSAANFILSIYTPAVNVAECAIEAIEIPSSAHHSCDSKPEAKGLLTKCHYRVVKKQRIQRPLHCVGAIREERCDHSDGTPIASKDVTSISFVAL